MSRASRALLAEQAVDVGREQVGPAVERVDRLAVGDLAGERRLDLGGRPHEPPLQRLARPLVDGEPVGQAAPASTASSTAATTVRLTAGSCSSGCQVQPNDVAASRPVAATAAAARHTASRSAPPRPGTSAREMRRGRSRRGRRGGTADRVPRLVATAVSTSASEMRCTPLWPISSCLGRVEVAPVDQQDPLVGHRGQTQAGPKPSSSPRPVINDSTIPPR